MTEFGQRLRQAREAKGLSLSQVEEVTKIRSKYLAALEAGDLKTLPGGIYTRGFLRTYAQTLGLDPQEILSLFESEEAPAPSLPEPQPVKKRVGGRVLWLAAIWAGLSWLRRKVSLWVWSAAVLLIVLVLSVGLVLHGRVGQVPEDLARVPDLSIQPEEPVQPVPQVEPPPPEPRPEPGRPEPTPSQVIPPPQAKPTPSVSEAMPEPESVIPEPERDQEVVEEDEAAEVAAVPGRVEITIEATYDSTWVRVDRSDPINMAQGMAQSWEAVRPLDVELGQAGMVRIWHNGVELRAFDHRVRQVRFYPDGELEIIRLW